MSSHADVLGSTATLLVVIAVIGWIISLVRRDATVAHPLLGVGAVGATWLAWAVGDGLSDRRHLLVAMVTIWGLRLSAHLWYRQRDQAEDFRYARLRARVGDHFAAASLFTVFLPHAVVLWVVSLPVQLAMTPAQPPVGALAIIGVIIWGIGLFFETVGDAQLVRFRRDPDPLTGVLDWGLWRYSRHPNHFGLCAAWWGLYLVAAETTDARWMAISPLLVTVLAVHLTGARAVDQRLQTTRPGYLAYARVTSAVLPRPPKEPTP
ncbi:MAG: DUF1295 domain-containing protein [Actinomycetota bacterium]